MPPGGPRVAYPRLSTAASSAATSNLTIVIIASDARFAFARSGLASISNITFGDIDTDAGNDWSIAQVGNEIVFTAPTGNALRST